MQQVIEGMMGVFFTVFMVFIGIGLAEAFSEGNEALAFKTEAIAMMEDSHYSTQVIKACFEQAKEKGYELGVTFYGKENSESVDSYSELDESILQEVTMAKVVVKYPFCIPLLKLDTQMQTAGIAY